MLAYSLKLKILILIRWVWDVYLTVSRILSMHFRSFTTRGHSLTTLTLALHELLHTISKYNSHHPLALTSHSWLHWSRSHLRTITQSLSPNHTRFINLGLPLAPAEVLYAHIATLADSYLTEPSQYHSLALLVVPCLISARVSWINPLALPFGLCLPLLDYCLCTWIISLPCHFGYVRRSSTPAALGLLCVLPLPYLFAVYWPCLYYDHVL